jgi:hypothetical protein
MDSWLVDGKDRSFCSRRESRLAFQATRKVKTRLGALEPPEFVFRGYHYQGRRMAQRAGDVQEEANGQ